MSRNWPAQELPQLDEFNCIDHSDKTNSYNCIAWAVGDTSRWWWPLPLRGGGNYWPEDTPRDETMEAFVTLFKNRGYTECDDGSLEDGNEKVAIFAKVNGRPVPTHAAYQLESGKWTSKLGRFEDVIHDEVTDVDGPAYGVPIVYLRRQRTHHPIINN